MDELYQMVNAFLPPPTTTHVSSSSSTFIATPNPDTFTTTPPATSIPLIDNYNFFYDDQMLLMGDTTTATPTTLVDEWDMMYAMPMDNGFSSHTNTIVASSSSSSFATATSTTTTTLDIPIINNVVGQTQDDDAIINLDLYGKVNSFSNSPLPPPPPPPSYNPPPASSTSSTTTTTTTTTTSIPYNYSDGTFEWNMALAGGHRSSTIFATTPTIPLIAAAGVHNQVTAAVNSNSTTATNTAFQGKRLNLYQPMNEKNIRNLLENSNNPLSYSKRQKAPLSTNNWPILSLPCLGKIPDPSSSTHKQQQQQHNQLPLQQRNGRQDIISKSTKIYAPHSSSKSKEWKKEKRVYKMPRHGLNSEMYSWRYYGEKLVNGSSNSRKYFKCSFKDCAAKRCVEMDEVDPDMVIMKYSGHHNHLMPMFLNNNSVNVGAPLQLDNNNKTSSSSKTISSSSPMILKNKDNTDNIFDGLEKLVDL